MGHTTQFKGELIFPAETTIGDIKVIEEMLERDVREHPEWKCQFDLRYIDLEFDEKRTALRWSGAEKTYYMEDMVTFIIQRVNSYRIGSNKRPFTLLGNMLAQGEEVGDVWKLTVVDGIGTKFPLVDDSDIIICPHCNEKFVNKVGL